CPYQCCYCSKNVFGSKYRAQSPSRTIEEIELLIKNYGIKEIYFNDDVFTQNMKKTEELCDLLIERKIDLTWGCSTRFNLVTPKLLEKMKKSGCITIGYGIESAEQSILDYSKKNTTIANIQSTLKKTREIGMEIAAFFMLGLPGETRQTALKTISFAKKIDCREAYFSLATPYPGTELYAWAKKNDYLITEDWSRYNTCEPLISTPNISESELRQLFYESYLRYYTSPKKIINLIKYGGNEYILKFFKESYRLPKTLYCSMEKNR
ncbi:MAG: radical SAM protein, partial [Candidatus Altiarchaeota archaeon]|nr:radical SAM protein [Candidatus Altiarchaeota archaeon]